MNEPLVDLLIITDGREEYLAQAVESAEKHLKGFLMDKWMYDDTGDVEYRIGLKQRYPDFNHFNGGKRQGFGGAIRYAWDYLLEHSYAHYIFHLEQDFVFQEDVDLTDLVTILEHRPQLAQIALKRQPWNEQEAQAGDICAVHPEAWVDNDFTHHGEKLIWCEQTLFFTTNPCLYRRDLMKYGWPETDQSEGHFSIQLRDQGYRFGFYGAASDGPRVHHIGHIRTGVGY